MIILMYHGVLPDDETDPILSYAQINRSAFEWQMQWLKQNAMVLSLADVVRMLQEGLRPPPRTTVLTFDDGFRNNARIAFPILDKYKLPATFFVSTAHLKVGCLLWFNVLAAKAFLDGEIDENPSRKLERLAWLRQQYTTGEPASRVTLEHSDKVPSGFPQYRLNDTLSGMNKSQLLQISQSQLIEIGSHTSTHPQLTRCAPEYLEYELCSSKKELEAITGKSVRFFAYPHGDHNPSVVEAVQHAGYTAALAVEPVMNSGTDLFRIPRVGIYGNSRIRFLAKCMGLQQVVKLAKSSFR